MNELLDNGRIKHGTWSNFENHIIYAKWLGEILGYTKPEDWYKITTKHFTNNHGGGLLSGRYNHSPIQFVKIVIKMIFPEYEWLEWKFNYVTNNYWKDTNNHIIYAKWLGETLGYTKPEDWYKITTTDFTNNYGRGLLIYYNNSPRQFIQTIIKMIFPDYEWLEWKFNCVPNNYWDNINNHKKYAEWLGKKLGYTKPEDWYKITIDDFRNNDGGGLIQSYNSSPLQFVKIVLFPELLEWKFIMVPNKFWEDITNHKKYAESLGKELGYTKPEDWYNITVKIIRDNYGGGLIPYYNNSAIQFVQTVIKTIFPDYEWFEWNFCGSVSMGYWEDKSNHKKYTEWLSKKLGYTKFEDWYNITKKVFIDNNIGGLLSNYYNDILSDFIMSVYPEYEWDKTKFYKYKTEAKLYNLLITIYPTSVRQFKQDWCKKIRHLSFDFCIPEYKIIIELDGAQHFIQVSKWSSPESQLENDKYKEKCANDNGYSVIRLLQEDVFDDTYDWFKELCDVIEEIKNNNDVSNIYLDRNNEYNNYIVNSQI